MNKTQNQDSAQKKELEDEPPPNLREKNGNNRFNTILRTRDNRRCPCYSLLPLYWQISRNVSSNDESSDYSA